MSWLLQNAAARALWLRLPGNDTGGDGGTGVAHWIWTSSHFCT